MKRTLKTITGRIFGEEVSEKIRQMPVSGNVSEVSETINWRHEMVGLQKCIGKSKNIIRDGRDIPKFLRMCLAI